MAIYTKDFTGSLFLERKITYSEQEVIYSERDVSYFVQEINYFARDVTYSEHKVTYSEHEVTYSEHEVIYSELDVIYFEQEISYFERDVTYYEHEVTYLEREVSDMAPRVPSIARWAWGSVPPCLPPSLRQSCESGCIKPRLTVLVVDIASPARKLPRTRYWRLRLDGIGDGWPRRDGRDGHGQEGNREGHGALDPSPAEYEQLSAMNCKDVRRLPRLDNLANEPSGNLAVFSAKVEEARRRFSHEMKDLEKEMPPKLAEEFKLSGRKYNLLFMD